MSICGMTVLFIKMLVASVKRSNGSRGKNFRNFDNTVDFYTPPTNFTNVAYSLWNADCFVDWPRDLDTAMPALSFKDRTSTDQFLTRAAWLHHARLNPREKVRGPWMILVNFKACRGSLRNSPSRNQNES